MSFRFALSAEACRQTRCKEPDKRVFTRVSAVSGSTPRLFSQPCLPPAELPVSRNERIGSNQESRTEGPSLARSSAPRSSAPGCICAPHPPPGKICSSPFLAVVNPGIVTVPFIVFQQTRIPSESSTERLPLRPATPAAPTRRHPLRAWPAPRVSQRTRRPWPRAVGTVQHVRGAHDARASAAMTVQDQQDQQDRARHSTRGWGRETHTVGIQAAENQAAGTSYQQGCLQHVARRHHSARPQHALHHRGAA